MSRIFVASLLFALLSLIIGCGGPESNFIGTWVNSKDSTSSLEISRNGDNFLIAHTYGKEQVKESSGAVYKDGILTIAGGFGGISFTYIEASDTVLMGGGTEYKRGTKIVTQR